MTSNLSSYNKTLGVCIPTYKRPDQLLRCVQSVIAAAEPYRVPIFITDDSVDTTNDAVIAQLTAQYPHIVYSRNEKNLGIDRNILHSANVCDCEFAWLLGEDDRMTPEGIATVLRTLESSSEPPAFLYVNYSYVDEHIAMVLREKLLPIEVDTTMETAQFFRQYGWAIGFIGSCVVNKQRWQNVDQEKHIGTYFAHVGTIMEAAAGGKVTLIAQPLILNRVGGADVFTWSDDAYGVFGGWKRMTERLVPIFGAEVCTEASDGFTAAMGLGTVRFLCAKRADAVYNLAVYNKAIRTDESAKPGYKFAALLVALAPAPLFGLTRALVYQVRRQRNRKLSGL